MNKELRTVLSISIIFNILFIGLLVGYFSHQRLVHRNMDYGNAVQNLPPDKQELIISTTQELKFNSKESREKIRMERKEIVQTLTAQEFNSEQFDKQVKELHATFGELTTVIASTVKNLAENLNQDERKTLARIMLKGQNYPESGENSAEPDSGNDIGEPQQLEGEDNNAAK